VPLEVAQKLADERDRLCAELQKARRQRDQLAGDQEAMARQIDSLEGRVREAEDEARSLREQWASRAEQPEPGDTEQDDQTDVVRRLSRRIDELTKDLSRVENRTQRAVEDARRQERVRLLAGLGEVLDSTERALDMQGAEGPWRQGLEAIHGQLIRYFEAEGAQLVGKVGEKMDPHRHEAVGVVAVEGREKGEIVNVERQGLVLENGTVVRTARVQVAA
jgi:molecular chaperone GrpE